MIRFSCVCGILDYDFQSVFNQNPWQQVSQKMRYPESVLLILLLDLMISNTFHALMPVHCFKHFAFGCLFKQAYRYHIIHISYTSYVSYTYTYHTHIIPYHTHIMLDSLTESFISVTNLSSQARLKKTWELHLRDQRPNFFIKQVLFTTVISSCRKEITEENESQQGF